MWNELLNCLLGVAQLLFVVTMIVFLCLTIVFFSRAVVEVYQGTCGPIVRCPDQKDGNVKKD